MSAPITNSGKHYPFQQNEVHRLVDYGEHWILENIQTGEQVRLVVTNYTQKQQFREVLFKRSEAA